MSLKSKDCLEYLEKELKKELIGPSDGLFNRIQYKKVDGKDKNYEANAVASLSFFPNEPSAMGISICIEAPEILTISLKNVGQYYKLTNKEEIPIESKIIAFYISKFNDENKSSYKWISSNYSLNNSNQNTVEDFISNVFEIKKSTFKNNVDYFDKFFDQ
ncbi:hypothetical protein OA670_03415, partial [Candidatus Pelagibacter sp.]|nr:hypothetical protein [Candidatus Pelagibacter sp.]